MVTGVSNDSLIGVDGMTLGEQGEFASIVIIYCFGVVGNLAVIFMIIFLKEYKKITHWYVLQLAFADILFLQFLPVLMYERIHKYNFDSIAICKARQTLLHMNYYASILFLTVMAVDRYLAVCHALSTKIQRLRSPRNSTILTLLIWLISITCSVPVLLYSNVRGIWPGCNCIVWFPTSAKDVQEWSFDAKMCIPSASLHKEIARKPEFTLNHLDRDLSYLVPQGKNITDFNVTFAGGQFPSDGSENGSATASGDGESDEFDLYDEELPEPDYDDMVEHNETAGYENTLSPHCTYAGLGTSWHVFHYVNATALFLVPLLVISICYGLIVKKLLDTSIGAERKVDYDRSDSKPRTWRDFLTPRRGKKSSNTSTNKSYKEKQRVSVMCAALVALFVACWLPYHAVHIANIVGIKSNEEFCKGLLRASAIIAFANSALNPYLYSILGTCKKRMRQVGSHKRVQAFLSVTGLTRIAGRSGSVGNSSETSRGKKSSVREDASTNGKSERHQLQTFRSEQNGL